ncbi:MAG TPA: hypothetical protein VFX89_08145 [Gammaproteobacteria bacterium]|nr:hypothetical protein [Gammaproteobacteria bacterium]
MEMVFLIPIVMFISLFSFCGVAFWSVNRRRERESLYLNETVRKIAELHGQPAVFDYLRTSEQIRVARMHAALAIGGIFAACGGAGMIIFMYGVEDMREEGIYFVGLIPLLVGLGLLTYSRLAAKP